MILSRVKEWRKQRGLTQEKLAQQSLVSLRTVQKSEKGCDVNEGTAKLLADALKVKTKDLV